MYIFAGIYSGNTRSELDPNFEKIGMETYFIDNFWLIGKKIFSGTDSVTEVDLTNLQTQVASLKDQFLKLGYDPEDVRVYAGKYIL